MTDQSRTGSTTGRGESLDDPFPRLVELLLDLLVHDVPGARGAQLSLDGAPLQEFGDVRGLDEPRGPRGIGVTGDVGMTGHREADDPRGRRDPAGGEVVSASAPAPGGGEITITVGADRPVGGESRERLRRFLAPMRACLALERELQRKRDRAGDAVALVETSAVLDIATGVVMARRNCDPATARRVVTKWAEREGLDLNSAPAASVLARLVAG